VTREQNSIVDDPMDTNHQRHSGRHAFDVIVTPSRLEGQHSQKSPSLVRRGTHGKIVVPTTNATRRCIVRMGVATTHCSFVVGAILLKASMKHIDVSRGEVFNPIVYAFYREASAAPILFLLSVATVGYKLPQRQDAVKVFFLGFCMFVSQLLYIMGVDMAGVLMARWVVTWLMRSTTLVSLYVYIYTYIRIYTSHSHSLSVQLHPAERAGIHRVDRSRDRCGNGEREESGGHPARRARRDVHGGRQHQRRRGRGQRRHRRRRHGHGCKPDDGRRMHPRQRHRDGRLLSAGQEPGPEVLGDPHRRLGVRLRRDDDGLGGPGVDGGFSISTDVRPRALTLSLALRASLVRQVPGDWMFPKSMVAPLIYWIFICSVGGYLVSIVFYLRRFDRVNGERSDPLTPRIVSPVWFSVGYPSSLDDSSTAHSTARSTRTHTHTHRWSRTR
jgi:hypothetical protein